MKSRLLFALLLIAALASVIGMPPALSQAIPLPLSENPKNQQRLSLLLDSVHSISQKNIDKSIGLADYAAKVADSLGEPLWKARFICKKGLGYRKKQIYDEALRCQYDALQVFQLFRDSVHIAKSMYEIGLIYTALKDYERALNYHFNSLYLREFDTNLMRRTISYLAIGDVLMKMNDNWRALDYFLNAKLILDKHPDSSLMTQTMLNMGQLMLKLQRYSDAIEHINNAIKLTSDEFEQAKINLIKANILIEINNQNEAVKILNEIAGTFKKNRAFEQLINVHQLFKEIRRKERNFEQALYHADLVKSYSDSLAALQHYEEISRLKLKFETQRLESENEILALKLKETSLQNRIILYIAVMLLLGIIMVLAIRVLFRNKLATRHLHEMNQLLEQKVEERTAELLQQENNLRQAYLALKKSEALFKAINETVPLGVALTDTSGKVILHNQHLAELGFKIEELENSRWFNHIVPEEQHQITELWNSAHKHRKPLPETVFRITLDKQLKWLRIRGVCLALEGEFSGMVIVMEDYTKTKNYENELIKAKNKAEESDKLKSAFLANMSHEIRTPMNAILGFADLLPSSEYTDEEKDEFISTIQSSGQLLLNLINDIIDISKIEAGELKIIPTTFELGELMETLFQTFSKQLEKAGKSNVKIVQSNKEASANYTIHTDKLRLQQILTNLLSNAIKFTLEGQIEFGVIAIGDQYQFYVKDTGIGIPESKLDVIFERFRQADDSHTKQFGGTGLGLAISRHLTHLLGGKIWVESVENKGTTFYFTIPHHHQTKERLKIYPDYSGKKVLVVEDVEANFHLLNNMLRRAGITVFHAPNGYVAIDIVQSEQPDMVLMDIQLPEMDGVTTLKNLRKARYNKPVVAITAFALAGDAEYYLRQGFDSYLGKPLGLEKLYQLLKLFFDPQSSLALEIKPQKNENNRD